MFLRVYSNLFLSYITIFLSRAKLRAPELALGIIIRLLFCSFYLFKQPCSFDIIISQRLSTRLISLQVANRCNQLGKHIKKVFFDNVISRKYYVGSEILN